MLLIWRIASEIEGMKGNICYTLKSGSWESNWRRAQLNKRFREDIGILSIFKNLEDIYANYAFYMLKAIQLSRRWKSKLHGNQNTNSKEL
jgi:hypothetical protein